MSEMRNREKTILRTSVIGIAANLGLAAVKAILGLLSHSIAIVLDAVNNLSDALSSLITMIGIHLASKAPDKKHPYGHGRAEYLSAAIIAVLVLYAGITAGVESVKKLLTPETPDYAPMTLLLIALAVGVKIALGLYFRKTGKAVHSDALQNSGQDALLDAVVSAATLAAAAIYLLFGLSLEAWLGLIIAGLIIRSGVQMLRETLSRVLGERIDASLSKDIKATVSAVPGVLGAYDLILHDYGPDHRMGSIHVAVPDTMSAREIDRLIRQITEAVYLQHGVLLTAVSIYAHNTTDSKAAALEEQIRSVVMAHDGVLQLHGLYLEEASKTLRFDIVVDFIVPDRKALHDAVLADVQRLLPGWHVAITMDADTSD